MLSPSSAARAKTEPINQWRARDRRDGATGPSGGDGSIGVGVLTSVIVSVLVFVAGVVFTEGRRPPWAVQPATIKGASGRARRPARPGVAATVPVDDDDDVNIVMDSLRALGLVRRRVDRPVVGRKAYVRLWERIRALVVLAAIVIGLGIVLAAVVGVVVLGAGFLLEQAIS